MGSIQQHGLRLHLSTGADMLPHGTQFCSIASVHARQVHARHAQEVHREAMERPGGDRRPDGCQHSFEQQQPCQHEFVAQPNHQVGSLSSTVSSSGVRQTFCTLKAREFASQSDI